MKSARREPLPALTSIRFFAAAWVVFFHLRDYINLGPFERVAGYGFCGVTLFFVLSGFILAYNYLDRDTPARDFWRARFARVYPAYLFALLLACPVLYHNVEHSKFAMVSKGWTSIALLQAWIPSRALIWNDPGWSLSAEAFFYAVFPFLLYPIARLARKHLAATLAVLWAISLLPTVFYAFLLPDGIRPTLGDHLFFLSVLKFNPLVRLPEFLIGIALGTAFSDGKRIKNAAVYALVSVAGVISIVSAGVPWYTVHDAAFAPLFGLLIFSLACIPRSLDWKPLVFLGEASYSLYLVHSSLISFSLAIYKRLGSGPHAAGMVASGLASIGLSCLVYRYLETPMRSLLGKKRAVIESEPMHADSLAGRP